MQSGSSVRQSLLTTACVSTALFVAHSAAFADIDPLSGIDFVTVGAVNNPGWTGMLPIDDTVGRGSVGYEYRIGKYEVTTAQWTEFFNAAFDRPVGDSIPFVRSPSTWGAQGATPQNPGGRRWIVPVGNEMRGVGGINWRTTAIFCNWLHNGKANNREAFMSGAYDVSTFGAGENGTFTDQLVRSPGAQYFLPSFDEWLKAAHYDPNKVNGDGSLGGWWRYADMSDDPLVYGPPGVMVNGQLAQANAAWDGADFPGFDPFLVPLGSYLTQSPWGLFDTAGMTSEWLEDAFIDPSIGPRSRLFDGTSWLTPESQGLTFDAASGLSGASPSLLYFGMGFRIAAVVPAPSSGGVVVGACLVWATRRRRSTQESNHHSCHRSPLL